MIYGTIYLDQQTIENVKIFLLDNTDSIIGSTLSNSQGYYEFDNLDPNVIYHIVTEYSDQHHSRSYPFIRDGDRVNIKLEEYSVASGDSIDFSLDPISLYSLTPSLKSTLGLSGTLGLIVSPEAQVNSITNPQSSLIKVISQGSNLKSLTNLQKDLVMVIYLDSSIRIKNTTRALYGLQEGPPDDSIMLNGFDLSLLGCILTRDTRYEGPSLKTQEIIIPGRHGSITIGSKLKSRLLETTLHLIETEEYNLEEVKEQIIRLLDLLSPNPIELKFTDDLERKYLVRPSGQIPLKEWIVDSEIEIPFKMYDPYIYGTQERVFTDPEILINRGSESTIIDIEIPGPIVDPEITIGDKLIKYMGGIEEGESLIIKKDEVTLNGLNTLVNLEGDLPILISPSKIIYSEGKESVKLVEGYSSGDGGYQSKRLDYLYFKKLEESTVTNTKLTYVMDHKVDLSDTNEIYVDWEGNSYSESAAAYVWLVVSTDKMGSEHVYHDRLIETVEQDFVGMSRRISVLDVSDLDGEYYVRVHFHGLFAGEESDLLVYGLGTQGTQVSSNCQPIIKFKEKWVY